MTTMTMTTERWLTAKEKNENLTPLLTLLKGKSTNDGGGKGLDFDDMEYNNAGRGGWGAGIYD